MNKLRFTPLVASLPASVPFVGPETQERLSGKPFKARLGANENGFGPSPKALAAMQKAAAEAWMYGDPESHDLRTALSRHHRIGMENIMVGEGIDGLLGYLVRLLVAPGDKVVTSAGAYPTFNYHVAGFGGELVTVPYLNDHEDPDALVARAKEVDAKLVYIANPDNPMGSWHDADTMQRMIDNLPVGCLMVLDEAYLDFAPDKTAPALQPDDIRVVRMRTFSKAYGMAGARVGYAIGARDLISAFNKVRNHFGMCRVSQAGAMAALGDPGWLQECITKVEASRRQLDTIARDNGLGPLPSATNFVTMDCGRDGDFARKLVQELAKLDIFVRMPFVAPQDRCIRVSCGPARDMELFAAALPVALNAANASMSQPG